MSDKDVKRGVNDLIVKRYKRFRWAQHILFWTALISCIAPIVIASIRVIPAAQDTESKLAFGGVGIFFIAITVLILFRNVVKKFAANIPCTLGVFVAMVAIALFLFLLEKIIDDALAIVVVGACGSFVGVLLEAISALCKMQADDIKRFYRGHESELEPDKVSSDEHKEVGDV